jgi:hypothetical protein
MVTWNSENNVKLLLMIIQNHFHGSPDYELLAREWGSEVSVASLKIQFCKIRRQGIKGVNNGIGKTMSGKGTRRGRPRKLKAEEGGEEMVCKEEEMGLEED